MLRLSVPVGRRLEDMVALDVHVAGAESNVCTALACLGRRCSWASRLPDNPLGQLVLRRLRAAGVDTSAVVLVKEGRVGTYYVEFATPPRPVRVIYDRADSAVSHMAVAEVDWETLLDTRVLHLTGITPVLSRSCRELVTEAIRRAHESGVAVSFDVNYRQRLWTPQEAAKTLRPLIANVELLFCSEADARLVFGCGGDARQVLEELRSCTGASTVVMTRGDAGALGWSEGASLEQAALPTQIVDRLGAGDAFAAGVLDGWLKGSAAEGLEQGVVLSALALSQEGDMLITSRAEVDEIRVGAGRKISR
jgi:2-dehydro-3-deoxygluconokinase